MGTDQQYKRIMELLGEWGELDAPAVRGLEHLNATVCLIQRWQWGWDEGPTGESSAGVTSR